MTTKHDKHPSPQPSPQPQPTGEVPPWASEPGRESVSVEANKPDHSPVPTPEPLKGTVRAGASEPKSVPPSVVGTTKEKED